MTETVNIDPKFYQSNKNTYEKRKIYKRSYPYTFYSAKELIIRICLNCI